MFGRTWVSFWVNSDWLIEIEKMFYIYIIQHVSRGVRVFHLLRNQIFSLSVPQCMGLE